MNWVEDTLRQLGRSIGIENLTFNARGVCCLSLQKSGELFIERREAEVFVYLARRIPYLDERVMEKALSLCHFRNVRSLPVVAGLKGDDEVIFLTRIREEEVSLPVLEEAIRLVMSLHERANE